MLALGEDPPDVVTDSLRRVERSFGRVHDPRSGVMTATEDYRVDRLAHDLRGLLETGQPFAVATVIGARGSSPRPPGAAMAVSADGEAVGSISGGCVEGAVYDTAERVLGGEGAGDFQQIELDAVVVANGVEEGDTLVLTRDAGGEDGATYAFYDYARGAPMITLAYWNGR